MREEFLVQQILNPRLAVLPLLAGGELLLQPGYCLLLRFDAVLIVVLDFVEVGHSVFHRLYRPCNRSEYLLVVLHP